MLSSCHYNFLYIAASSENSFSSDSSHEYCVPPENISPPEPPAHRKDLEDVDGIYVEVRQLYYSCQFCHEEHCTQQNAEFLDLQLITIFYVANSLVFRRPWYKCC